MHCELQGVRLPTLLLVLYGPASQDMYCVLGTVQLAIQYVLQADQYNRKG